MKKKSTVITLVILLSSIFTSAFNIQPVKTSGGQSDIDWWPMFHHGLNHLGYSTSAAPATNHTLWNFTTQDPYVNNDLTSSPAVVGGIVYVGSQDHYVYALNATTGVLIWRYLTGNYVYSSPAVSGGIVYIGSYDSNVYALNASTGAFKWSYATGGLVYSSPAVAGGMVYIGATDCKVYALNATTGAFVWKYATGGGVTSSPAVVSGIVYVGSQDYNVYALNATSGTFMWNYPTGGLVMSSPGVVGGIVYVGSEDGTIYALNATTGTRVWKYTTGGLVDSSPAIAGGIVYVGSGDTWVYALNAATGARIWKNWTHDVVDSSPAVAGGMVYIGSKDHKVYALNATSGTLVWSYTTGNAVSGSPAVAGGVVYVGSYDHKIYAIGPRAPQTIYIRADGSVDPPSAPILRSGNSYTLTGNIYSSASPAIVIEKNGITLDGAGHTIQGSGSGEGIDLTNRISVKITNVGIKGFFKGINLYYSSNNVISGDNISGNAGAVWLVYSSGNMISQNTIASNYNASILLDFSYFNSILGNNVKNNRAGVALFSSSNNTIYHNNFLNNTWQVQIPASGYIDFWDNGYPSGGNYWYDYNGTDVYSGPYQNEIGSDGIGDTHYIINMNNKDDYPLMESWPAPKAATVTIGTTFKISVLDPAAAYDPYTWEVLNNIGEGLLKYTPGTTNLTCGIAENYTVSPSQLNYTFKLRSGMRFTDGAPLDAAAVKWSIDRVIRLEQGPAYLVSDYVYSVNVVNPLTVRFNLKKAAACFPSLVAEAPYFPVSSKSYPANQTAEPTVGQYGPYKIRSWTRDVELVLEANPTHYGTPPLSKYVVTKTYANSTIMRQALQNGQIDIAWFGTTLWNTDLIDLKKDLHFNFVGAPDSTIRFVIMRCNGTPFDDVRLRQAVAAAINRTRISTEAYSSLVDPLYSMVPVGVSSHIDAFKNQYGVCNLTLSRQLLNAAGYNTTNKFQFDLWYSSTHYGSTEPNVANIIKSDLEETGMITVTLKTASWATYRANMQAGVMPIFLLGWYPDYLDPDDYLTPFVYSTQSPALGVFYNNPVMDAILDEAMVEQNTTKRMTLYENAQSLLAQDAPVISLIQGRQYAFTKPNIKGINPSPNNLLPYSTIYEVENLTEYPWSMFHQSPSHSGYTESPAPRTNQKLWNYTTGSEVWSSPAVVGGKVYIGSGNGSSNEVYALNATTGALMWNYTTGGIVYSSPAVAGGKVYLGSYADGTIYALDAATGAPIWNYTTGGSVYSSPAVAGGMLFIGSQDFKVYALNASTGALIWNYTTGRDIVSSPAVADGKVFIGSYDRKIYALDASTGALIWNYTTGSGVWSSPAVVDGKVYVGSDDDNVYCLNASTGAFIWSYATGDSVSSSPAVAGGTVFIGSGDGKVYALNASTGTLIWNYTTGTNMFSSPAVAGGMVFIGSTDCKVYALNASTGAQIWSYTTSGNLGILSSPAVADGVVFIGSLDNAVYAFGNIVRVPENYPTVQAAVNAATPGATIIIEPGDYHESVIINKTLTILGIKGSGTTFTGGGSGIAITITGTGASGTNVIQVTINNYAQGISIDNSAQCSIYDNIMYSMTDSGIALKGSNTANTLIYDNTFQNNYIALNLTQSSTGNTIYGNIITLNSIGLYLRTGGNTIYANTISQNTAGINLANSNNNAIYWNNFESNTQQVTASSSTGNVWDQGYPTGGNYWSNYAGIDNCCGLTPQTQPGPDGIGDTPYTVYGDMQDHYPLMKPFGGSHDIGIIDVTCSKTVIGQGYILSVTVKVLSYAIYTDTRNIKIYAGSTIVASQDTSIACRSCITLTFTWDTTNYAKGNYIIKVYATPITDDVDTNDNTRQVSSVMVTIPGDINGDKVVNNLDLYALSRAFLTQPGMQDWNPNANINNDSIINKDDMSILSHNFGKSF